MFFCDKLSVSAVILMQTALRVRFDSQSTTTPYCSCSCKLKGGRLLWRLFEGSRRFPLSTLALHLSFLSGSIQLPVLCFFVWYLILRVSGLLVWKLPSCRLGPCFLSLFDFHTCYTSFFYFDCAFIHSLCALDISAQSPLTTPYCSYSCKLKGGWLL